MPWFYSLRTITCFITSFSAVIVVSSVLLAVVEIL